MRQALRNLPVGSEVYLNVDGVRTKHLILHQGNPDTSKYHSSCTGTWIVNLELDYKSYWASGYPYYKSSMIHEYCTTTYLEKLEPQIRDNLNEVTLGYETDEFFTAKVFCLRGDELTGLSDAYCSQLSYFETISKAERTFMSGWLRDEVNTADKVKYVDYDGNISSGTPLTNRNVRPVCILGDVFVVNDEGDVLVNNAAVITCNAGPSGTDLGEQGSCFSLPYSVSDMDNDEMTIIEKIDSEVVNTRTITTGSSLKFDVLNASQFQLWENGSTHTIEIEVTDASLTTIYTATFTKHTTNATISLAQPLEVEGDIASAAISVLGNIPAGAIFKVEATNNAKDEKPVWQDITEAVKAKKAISFTNKTAANGAAFNFRVTVERTEPEIGGYITGITGAFE